MKLDQTQGCLVGLAVGDAVGTTNEFNKDPVPLFDMIGDGPFGLEPGQWTDDTSMALAMRDSLRFMQGFNYREQLDRYVMWWKDGKYSSTGQCFDMGNQTRRSLMDYAETGVTISQDTAEVHAGNGSLMRLAPVLIYYHKHSDWKAEYWAGESSRTTHATRQCVDACKYFARLVRMAVNTQNKQVLLDLEVDDLKLHRDVYHAATINYRVFERRDILNPSGYVATSLMAALWAFYNHDNFKDGCLAVANLGGDADTTAAIYGQIAGAFYGLSGIPTEWVDKIYWKEWILKLAEDLHNGGVVDTL